MILRPGLGRHVLRPKLPILQYSRPTRRFQHNNYSGTNESDSFLLPGQRSALSLLKGFIAVNCVVAAVWQFATIRNKADSASLVKTKHDLERTLNDKFVMRKDDIARGKYWGAILSNFSHKEVLHLGFNMMAFWSLGNGLITSLPQMNAARFFTLCTGSALGTIVGSFSHKQAQDIRNGSLGASGIISGIITAVAMRAPFSKMQFIFLPGVGIPTWIMTAAFFSYSAYQVTHYDPRSPPIFDHAGHLGGAVFGALYYLLALRRARVPRW
ncbi:hypothetical protein HDK90DRAFT_475215 [Phyllosticta capitalensis]|uniref:Peptidase S54 rhomboid domain-containing protein n=1 Tax=Phyllosticta capitalensis TaxID=121624 RepID=A0ABR1YXV0_9PEZI